ncbi:hypothetical protein OG884_18590 [Streptosporangium sp. NBC_01755]|uniref:hypothetical protein n=1 Tax=unclassified Streptosporangium TaxID=2632669 RepID=UPI002DDB29CA|nr:MULTISPECIES: hypothetical protein [unclassified Streptosporangium]WSA23724.1 hypothetical protein OIE13_22545 [Streptosporangium sp. NBC_01810]WSD03816.1 hypothetical protein OG884_18590 [Streptosporangium sp. NBC_01755]
MTATITDQQAADIIAAALLAKLPAGARDQLIRDLSVEDRRAAYAAANRMPRRANALTDDIEQMGEITVVPCDHGGWQIHHPATGLVLDTEGCWIDTASVDLASIAGEDNTTWSSKDLAVAAALATL